MEHLPLIAIEVVMIFGGAIAFGWWQLRDLDREKKKREQAQARAESRPPEAATGPASSQGTPASSSSPSTPAAPE